MPPAPITVLIADRALPGEAARAVRELGELIASVFSLEPDCLAIRMLRDEADPERLLLVEAWTSRAAYLGPHLETPHLGAFRARAAEFLAGPPEISFWSTVADATARPAA